MFKKLIKFEDLDGNAVEEEFYFSLNPAEIAKFGLKYGTDGDLEAYFAKVMQEKNALAVMGLIEDLLSMSVGKRSVDNRRFVKTPETTADFMESGAFSSMFLEMAGNPKVLNDFFIGVVPSNISDELAKKLSSIDEGEETPAKEYTHEELLSMSDEDFRKVAGSDPKKMSHTHLQIAFQRKVEGKK